MFFDSKIKLNNLTNLKYLKKKRKSNLMTYFILYSYQKNVNSLMRDHHDDDDDDDENDHNIEYISFFT
jgi:hypothetical protein